MKKIISAFICALILCCTFGIVSCVQNQSNTKFELTKELPQEVVCGSEIYFKEYIPIDFEAEYDLTVSYFDCTKLKQVENEEVESLMFRFSHVSKYDFKLSKADEKPIEFSINSVPVAPEFKQTEVWQTNKGTSIVLNDLLFWCYITLEDDGAKIDPSYKFEFVSVEVKSIFVDGEAKTVDLAGQTSYTFEEEAEYIFTVKASNSSGEQITTAKVATMNLAYHASEVGGYVFDDQNKIEFDVNAYADFALPTDGGIVKARLGNTKYDAVYDASSKMFTVSDFEQTLPVGVNERLYLTDNGGAAYSVNVVVPDLIITEDNFKELELVKEGTIILGEDIDMTNVTEYGKSRSGSYKEYTFRGLFDGRGYTIKNYTTTRPSYTGSLLWAVEGATIKNIIFEDATVTARNSVVAGRTGNYTKFINIAVEVKELNTTDNSSVISGPGESGITYENCILFVKATKGETIKGTGFINGFYCRSAEFKNVYLVSDATTLPVVPTDHPSITPTINGSHESERWTLSEAEEQYAQGYDFGTDLLNEAASIYFCGPVTYTIDSSNVDMLLTATEGIFSLTEDIDMQQRAWSPNGTFTGTIEGNGFKIKNFKAKDSGNFGLIEIAGEGAKIKNLSVHITSNGVRGGLIGQVKGKTTVENVNIICDSLYNDGAYPGGVIANVIQGELTVKDTNIVIKAVSGTHALGGFIAAGESNSNSVIVENVVCYNPTGAAAMPYVPKNTTDKDGTVTYGTYGTDGALAEANVDYVIYASIDELLAASKADELSEEFKGLLDDAGIETNVVFITQDNIDVLLTATDGIYSLSEDIDMQQRAWAPTAQFAGRLDGNGHKIINFKSPQNSYGLVYQTGAGATIKNLTVHMTTNGLRGGLIGQVKGATTVENVNIICDSLYNDGSYPGGTIANVIQGELTVKDTNIIIKAVSGANALGGFIAAAESSNKNVIVSNVVCYNPSGNATTPYNPSNAAYGTLGTDGKAAEANVDYVVYTSITELLLASQENKLSEEFKGLLSDAKIELSAVFITEDNIDVLLTATDGIYILTEDIDMKQKAWDPSVQFAGTLDGNGHKIINFKSPQNSDGLFYQTGAGATIKNLTVHMTTNGLRGGLIGQVKGATKVENVNIICDSLYNDGTYPGGTIANVIQGQLTVKDTNIVIKAVSGAGTLGGFIAAGESNSDSVIVENVVCYNPSGYVTTPYAPKNATNKDGTVTYGTYGTDGKAADANVDYFLYQSVEELQAATLSSEFTALLTDAGIQLN